MLNQWCDLQFWLKVVLFLHTIVHSHLEEGRWRRRKEKEEGRRRRRKKKKEKEEGRKEMFYLTSYSTHFIYGYGVEHMVKVHSDSKRGNLMLPHMLLFPINSKGSFYMHHPTDRIAHTTTFVIPVVEHWLE